MLQPKKPKFRKQFKGRMHGNSKGGNLLNFGAYGLKALTPARITSRQIESARRCISRHLKRSGRVWIRIFPDVPVTKKPAEVRQGKGKGAVEFWAARFKPGKILFEIDGVARRIYVGENIGGSGWTLVEVVNQEAVVRRNGEVRSVFVGQQF